MDTAFWCYIKGTIGIIFGLLALLLPDFTFSTFLGLFWIFIAVGIAGFLFLATTGKSEESLLWFGLAAMLLLLGVASLFAPSVMTIIFILIIVGAAAYSGLASIQYALSHPKTIYYLVPGIFFGGVLLVAAMIKFVGPFLNLPLYTDLEDYILVGLGSFTFVFGIVSILIGTYYSRELNAAFLARPAGNEGMQVKPGVRSFCKPKKKK
jgi:hypothetical protein